MIIYHGSKFKILAPKEMGSNKYNDYGPSFYLTLDDELAKSWACKNGSLGIVNKYYVNSNRFNELKILDLTKKDKYSVLNWMAILMHFRKLDSFFKKNNELVLKWLERYYIDVTKYDVVIGYRADDSYFRFPIRFVSNDLAFEDLEKVFLLANLGVQYAFMSSKAIKLLKFKNVIECESSFLGHHYLVVKKASDEFDKLINTPRDPNKTYILDMMRKDDEH